MSNAVASPPKRSYRRRALEEALATGVVWEDPPATSRPASRGAPSMWVRRLHLLDSQPGQYGRLALYETSKDASNVASYLRAVIKTKLEGRYEIHAREVTVEEAGVDANGREVLIPVTRGAIYGRLIVSTDEDDEVDEDLLEDDED